MKKRTDLSVVVLAAGKGKRMKSERPKVMFDLAGWPLVRHVAETAKALKPARLVVVAGHGMDQVKDALAGYDAEIAVQKEQRGTGHAVRCASRKLSKLSGTVLVLYGDVPLIPTSTLKKLLSTHHRRKAAVTILTAEAADPTGYGRILRDETKSGSILAIVEEKDATTGERDIREINTGIMAFRSELLWPALRRLKADNAQKELYLTDVPALLIAKGEKVVGVQAEDFHDVRGVNSLADLAETADRVRTRIVAGHMESGIRIVDPSSTWIDRGVRIKAGTTIFPFTVITGDVQIGKGCEVGPFSHLRTGATLKDGAQIGNFVEVKQSVVGRGTKAKHLTYLGDAVIGDRTNVGCGTITANYDGKHKHRTTIGDEVHVGSGTVFVAPLTVGDRVTTGAGAVILAGNDVSDGETMVGVPARALPAGKEQG